MIRILILTSIFALSFAVTPAMSAEGLTEEQKQLVRDKVRALSKEERQEVRQDKAARREFIDSIGAELTEQERKDFRQRWKAMSREERHEVLDAQRNKRSDKRAKRAEAPPETAVEGEPVQ